MTFQVSSAHTKLKESVPYYEELSETVIMGSGSLASKACEEYPIIKETIAKADELGAKVVATKEMSIAHIAI